MDDDLQETARFTIEAQMTDDVEIRLFQEKELLSKEVISMEVVKSIVSQVEVSDVLPTNMPRTSVRNHHQFCKHMLFPFIGITGQSI